MNHQQTGLRQNATGRIPVALLVSVHFFERDGGESPSRYWCQFIFLSVALLVSVHFFVMGSDPVSGCKPLPSREGAPGGLDRASGFPFPL